MQAKWNRRGGAPARQTRARTPPPTARMLAMGRVHKPSHQEESRGSRRPIRTWSSDSRHVFLSSGKGDSGKASSKTPAKPREPSETEESEGSDDDDDDDDDDDEDDEELIPDSQQPEKLVFNDSSAAALDEDSDDNEGIVPGFIFNNR